MEYIHLLAEKFMGGFSCPSQIYSCTLNVPGIQVLTCALIVDAYKQDLVITFKSLKEFLLSYPTLEESNVTSLLPYLSLF